MRNEFLESTSSFDLTVVIMSILPSNTHKMCYTIYISKVKELNSLVPKGRIRPALRPQDNFSWASNCFVGPPSIGKSIALKITPFELCEIVWFPWQQAMRFKTVRYVPTNNLYLSRNSS